MGRRSSCPTKDGERRLRRPGRVRIAATEPHTLSLSALNKQLFAENVRLRAELEKARRAGKRQVAPFSKGDPKTNPAKPGRKPGAEYGTKARRPVPDHVDEEIFVPMPDACPCCQGGLDFEDEVDQYQQEIVQVPGHVRRYRIARGRCRDCGRRAQGRHPDQSSDAIGAAGSQIGPQAIAIAA